MQGDLIERLERATGPDRELDYDIWATVEPSGVAATTRTEDLLMPWSQWREFHVDDKPVSIYGQPQNHQAYTASLDAAVALVERVRPGWRWAFEKRKNGTALAWFDDLDIDEPSFPAVAATPAIALVLALLRALKEGERDNG